MLTSQELEYYKRISERIKKIHNFLNDHHIPQLGDSGDWYNFLAKYKSIQGNLYNDISFIATLMAKELLCMRYKTFSFDAAGKAQGAPGLDIDVHTKDGLRIIAEIKTTYPYKSDDLGAQQKASFKRDFDKLNSTDADEKFFFVTEQRTFDLMLKPEYKSQIPEVQIVLLPSTVEKRKRGHSTFL